MKEPVVKKKLSDKDLDASHEAGPKTALEKRLIEEIDRKKEIIATQQHVIGMQMERNRRTYKAYEILSVYLMELFATLEDPDQSRQAFYKWQIATNELDAPARGDER